MVRVSCDWSDHDSRTEVARTSWFTTCAAGACATGTGTTRGAECPCAFKPTTGITPDIMGIGTMAGADCRLGEPSLR